MVLPYTNIERTIAFASFTGGRRYPENGARYVPKVHSAVMHSTRNHAPTSFFYHGHGDFSLLTSRDRRIPTLAPAVLSLYGYFYLFLREAKRERTQSDITDPETA